MKTSGTTKRWNIFSKKTLKSLYASHQYVEFMATQSLESIASIIGAGLHDEEITISFAKMIHRKIKAQETGTTFPLSAENLSGVIKTQFT